MHTRNRSAPCCAAIARSLPAVPPYKPRYGWKPPPDHSDSRALTFGSARNWLETRNPDRPEVFFPQYEERNFDMLGTILIVVLLLLLLGAWPSWPYSRGWGYYPSGTLGLVLVIVLVLALMGRV